MSEKVKYYHEFDVVASSHTDAKELGVFYKDCVTRRVDKGWEVYDQHSHVTNSQLVIIVFYRRPIPE